jgi:primosomal protein N' (replication factor Y)
VAIQTAARHDFAAFAAQELPICAEFQYPPAAVMIRLVVRGPSEMATEHFAEHVVKQVRETWTAMAESAGPPATPDAWAGGGFRILGPSPAPMAKLRGLFRFHALLQGQDRDRLRAVVRQATADLKPPADIQWIVDVDPFDVL